MSATESDAFIAAIVANPGDDTPRLVYADWLDEHDQSLRAEFIRLQIKLARNPYINQCTGVSANWCPACGDCACPDADVEWRRNDPNCPLHAPESPHGQYHTWYSRDLTTRKRRAAQEWLMTPFGPASWRSMRRGFVSEVTFSRWYRLIDDSEACRELFRQHPITWVSLSGESLNVVGNLFRWPIVWPCISLQGPAARRFPTKELVALCGPEPRAFATEAEARGAMSRALVNYGRDLAQLPKFYRALGDD